MIIERSKKFPLLSGKSKLFQIWHLSLALQSSLSLTLLLVPLLVLLVTHGRFKFYLVAQTNLLNSACNENASFYFRHLNPFVVVRIIEP